MNSSLGLQCAHFNQIGLRSYPKITQIKGATTSRKVLRNRKFVVAAVSDIKSPLKVEEDSNGFKRLSYEKDGYQTWIWRGHKINFLVAGEENKEAIVLVHGFGASVYHWRYNIPKLSEKYKVFAIDLLGFGWSEKALVDYNAKLWREQLADFLRDVVGQPAVLAGNSVGGYAVLSTGSFHPELVRGLILLNVAGQYKKRVAENEDVKDTSPNSANLSLKAVLSKVLEPLKAVVQRIILYITFLQAKQPIRIRQVLKSVYPDGTNVDDLLVESIVSPAEDPNAAEVYFRLTSKVLLDSSAVTLNELVEQLKLPVLLLWGDLDPWMTPAKAQQFLSIYPRATKVGVQAGHCPHDEKPKEVNLEIAKWISSL